MKPVIIFFSLCALHSVSAQYGPIKKKPPTHTTPSFPNGSSQGPNSLEPYPGPQPGNPLGPLPGNPSGPLPGNPSGPLPGNPSGPQPSNPSGSQPYPVGVGETNLIQPSNPWTNNPSPQNRPSVPNQVAPAPNNQPQGGPYWWQQSNPFEGSSAPKGVVHVQEQPKQPGATYYGLSTPQPPIPPPRPQGGVPPQTSSGVYTTSAPYTGPLNTTPYPGCAAALKCVDEIYCTAEGVMSDVPVQLTREQSENRVPLSICQDLDTGTLGKCCRDPNYKDPWPGGMDTHQHHHHDDNQPDPCGGQGICIPTYLCKSQNPGSSIQTCRVPSDGSSGVCCASSPQQQPARPPQPQFNPPQPQPARPPQPQFIPQQPQPARPIPQQSYPQQVQTQNQPGSPVQPQTYPQQPQPVRPIVQQPEIGNPIPQPSQNSPSQNELPLNSNQNNNKPPTPPLNHAIPQPSKSSYPTTPQNFKPVSSNINQTPNQGFDTPQKPFNPPLNHPQSTTNQQIYVSSSSTPQLPSSNYPNTISPNPSTPFQNPQQIPNSPQIHTTSSVGPSYPQKPPAIHIQPTSPPQTPNYGQPIQQNIPQPSPQAPIQPGSSCGVRRPGLPSPVQYGTAFGEFPWHVLILSITNNSGLCSGVLIQNNAVLAPAQCLKSLTPQQIVVKAGLWRIDGNGQQKPPQESKVIACAKHPSYDPSSLFNDLAVLILSKPFNLDYHIDILCLPDNSGVQNKKNCIGTGWGKSAFLGGPQPQTLNQVPIRLMNGEHCQEQLRQTFLGKYFQLNPSFECALPISEQDDLCKVDMGSPIACPKSNGNYELAGLYSWDVGCTTNNNPSVISRPDVEWIKNTLAKSPEQIASESNQEELRKQLAGQSEFDTGTKPGFSQGYGR